MWHPDMPDEYKNQIVTGDARELAKRIPDESIDLIYADFVYDDLDFGWVDDCVRIMKPTASIYAQTDFRSVAQLKIYLDDRLVFKNWIVWCYRAMPTRKRYYQRKHDDILFYNKSENYCWNNPTQPPQPPFESESGILRFKIGIDGKILNPTPSMRKRGPIYIRDVICRDWWDDIPVPSGFKRWKTGKKLHEWQKPEALLKRIIEASSNIENIIYDPFVGSGTTISVCKQLGRNYIAFEIDPDTAELARERVQNTQPPLFVMEPE